VTGGSSEGFSALSVRLGNFGQRWNEQTSMASLRWSATNSFRSSLRYVPLPTRWLSSMDLMYVATSSYHPASDSPRLAPCQYSISLPHSHIMIVGSFLCSLPVMWFSRVRSVSMKFR
jgi:hypothetical protein